MHPIKLSWKFNSHVRREPMGL